MKKLFYMMSLICSVGMFMSTEVFADGENSSTVGVSFVKTDMPGEQVAPPTKPHQNNNQNKPGHNGSIKGSGVQQLMGRLPQTGESKDQWYVYLSALGIEFLIIAMLISRRKDDENYLPINGGGILNEK